MTHQDSARLVMILTSDGTSINHAIEVAVRLEMQSHEQRIAKLMKLRDELHRERKEE